MRQAATEPVPPIRLARTGPGNKFKILNTSDVLYTVYLAEYEYQGTWIVDMYQEEVGQSLAMMYPQMDLKDEVLALISVTDTDFDL